MKLCRLDLMAFGHFSGTSLNLGRGQYGVDLIYGPNEAGKSTTLRAVQHLLFGFPARTADSFLHPYDRLRIGGLIERSDRTRVEFIRRKGNTKTLRAADDAKVLDDSVLQTLLGGIDEAAFATRFGLDGDELRRGGQAVVDGGGDLGELLFAAAAGAAGLHATKARIDEDANALYLPRGRRQINQLLTELSDVRKRIRDAILPGDTWEAQQRAVEDARRQAEVTQRELLEQRAELQRLCRHRDAHPLLLDRQRVLRLLEPLAETPRLRAGFRDDRLAARQRIDTLSPALESHRRQAERLRADLDTMRVPTALLQRTETIRQLQSELSSRREQRQQLPVWRAERDALTAQVERVTAELSRYVVTSGPGAAAPGQTVLSRPERRRLQELITQHAALKQQRETADRQLARSRDELAGMDDQQPAAAPPGTVQLEQAVRRAREVGSIDATITEMQSDLNDRTRQWQILLGGLALWKGSVEDLERLPVPVSAVIDQHEAALAELDVTLRRCREALARLDGQITETDQRLEKLRGEQDVPTEDELRRSREVRDIGWRLIRPIVRGDARDAQAEAEWLGQAGAGGDLVNAMDTVIRQSDDMADRLRREAGRVAEHAELIAARRRCCAERDQLRDEESAALRRRETLLEEWRRQWQPCGLEPQSAAVMREWLSRRAQVLQVWSECRGIAGRLERLTAQRDELRGRLRIELQRLDCGDASATSSPSSADEAAPDTPLARLLQLCEDRLCVLAVGQSRHEQFQRDRQRLLRDVQEQQARTDEAAAAQQAWTAEWHALMTRAGLAPDITCVEATAVLELLDEQSGTVCHQVEFDARIATAQQQLSEFEQRTRTLLADLDDDADSLPDASDPFRILEELTVRLTAGQQTQARREKLEEALEREQQQVLETDEAIAACRNSLQSLCAEARCESEEQLPEREEASEQQRRLTEERDHLERQLERLAEGAPLSDFIAAVSAESPVEVESRIDELHRSTTSLEERLTVLNQQVGREQNQLDLMDGQSVAAVAREDEEQLLARLRDNAEQYARLKLASALLTRTMERFREKHQGPVLERASTLFRDLTLGSFTGLRADYDDNGKPVISGIRGDTEQTRVPVSGMSEGTCDQLYLALRLASLEAHVRTQEPIPFLIDDLLIRFDDDRSRAALKVLGELSRHTQVIIFTHHEHLLELASATLSPNVLTTHHLTRTR